jgi:hypothetical protein
VITFSVATSDVAVAALVTAHPVSHSPRITAQQITRGIALSARAMAPLTSDQYRANARRP